MSTARPAGRSNRRRRFGVVALAASALVATQLSGLASASASTAAADGGPAGAKAGVSSSQVPYLVRSGAAKMAHPMKTSDKLRIVIGLNLHNQADLDKFKAAVQDPKSAQYHRYMTADEFNARYGPTAAEEAAVISFGRSQGLAVTKRYSNRLLVDFDGTVAQIQKAFKVQLNEYTIGKKQYFANASDPVLPDSLKPIVSSVSGLDNVGQMQSASGSTDTSKLARYAAGPTLKPHVAVHANGSMAKLKAAVKAKAAHPNITNGYYDPTDVYSSQAYDVNALQNVAPCCNPNHVSTGTPAATSIAIATAGAHNISAELAGFQGRYNYLSYNVNEYYIDGTPSGLDFEGTMDVEWALAMGNSYGSYLDTPHVYLYSGVNAAFTTFHDIYNSILTNNTAKIVSSSWGCTEFYCISDAQMNTDHTIYDSMVAQGFTMVNSSGDRGAYADCSHVSTSNPAADPDWLGIGATELHLTSGPVYSYETTWGNTGNCSQNGGGSGGGCSAKYAKPSWQSGTTICDSIGKAVPDVSLNGSALTRQNVYWNGGWYGGAGTSISAPMYGGFFARANSYLVQLGNACGSGSPCPTLGNPGSRIWNIASGFSSGRKAFYDIADGTCTDSTAGSGYCAITGYDRATGWGSANLLDLAWGLNWYSVPEASAPSVTLTGPATNVYVTSGTVSWSVVDNGSPATGVAGYTSQWDADPGNPLSATTPGAGNTYYSGPAVHATSGSTSLLDGCHTLFVRAWDNMGLSTVSSYGPVCKDTTAPTVSKPLANFVKNQAVPAANAALVRYTWNGADSQSGINQYLVFLSTDGGSYVQVTPATPTTNQVDVKMKTGHTYVLAVGAYDGAGNFSTAYSYSTSNSINADKETDSSVTYSSGWHTSSDATALDGATKFTTLAGKTASFAFTGGKAVMWVAPKASGQGSASVSVDGGSAVTVNTRFNTPRPARGVYRVAVNGAGAHTFLVTNLATAGHPRVDVDGFFVLR